MKNLIVVPARGGSKGIPLKNIYPLNGKPLLEYTLEVALAAGLEDTDIAVSTDSGQIAKVAMKYREVYLVERPYELSGDTASTEMALLHTIAEMEQKLGKKYDSVMTLQPTSPLRKKETLAAFYSFYQQHYPAYDALLSLTENRSDFWCEKNGKFERLFQNAPRRRQERKPLYIENSAYYITSVEALKQTNSVLGNHVNGFVISEEEGVDINEIADIYIAEAFIR